MLLALVAHREADPGSPLTRDQLFAAGWPGERAQPEAAAQRVHTAIWTLRTLGLRDVLIGRDDGYLLDPELVIERVS
jgi:DNA-binding SARP family transcriptional activator